MIECLNTIKWGESLQFSIFMHYFLHSMIVGKTLPRGFCEFILFSFQMPHQCNTWKEQTPWPVCLPWEIVKRKHVQWTWFSNIGFTGNSVFIFLKWYSSRWGNWLGFLVHCLQFLCSCSLWTTYCWPKQVKPNLKASCVLLAQEE